MSLGKVNAVKNQNSLECLLSRLLGMETRHTEQNQIIVQQTLSTRTARCHWRWS